MTWRFIREGIWLPAAWAECKRYLRDEPIDCVLTSSPPQCVHYLGLLLKRRYHLPWVADFRDPWITNKMPVTTLSHRVDAYLERQVLLHADRIIANTPLTHEGYQAVYPQFDHKLDVVPNGFDPDRFEAPKPLVPRNEQPTLLHAGELYAGRDPRGAAAGCTGQSRPKANAGAGTVAVLVTRPVHGRAFRPERPDRRAAWSTLSSLADKFPTNKPWQPWATRTCFWFSTRPAGTAAFPPSSTSTWARLAPSWPLPNPMATSWALGLSGAPYRLAPPLDAASIEQRLVELYDNLTAGTLTQPTEQQRFQFTRERLARNMADNLNRSLGPTPTVRTPDTFDEMTTPDDDEPQSAASSTTVAHISLGLDVGGQEKLLVEFAAHRSCCVRPLFPLSRQAQPCSPRTSKPWDGQWSLWERRRG